MRAYKAIRAAAAVMTAAAVILLAGCQPEMPPQKRVYRWNPEKVAVLPFQRVAPLPTDPTSACSPLTGAVCTAGPIRDDAEMILTQALREELTLHTDLEVVPPALTRQVASQVVGRGLQYDTRKMISEVGQRLKTDAVLVGYVYRFRERKGSAYGADEGASVAFDLSLVRSEDGSVLWKDTFDQTQQPLTNNILRLGDYMKHGVKWLTADEFGRYGMTRLMEQFPWRKGGIK